VARGRRAAKAEAHIVDRADVSSHTPSRNCPSARRADVVDNYFGTKVADPYRWMEDLNSPELKQWIDAENALAFGYLNALPQRDVATPGPGSIAGPFGRYGRPEG
jgi:hypothetical protein